MEWNTARRNRFVHHPCEQTARADMTATAIWHAPASSLRRLGAWLADAFAAERDRWALWLPVAGGIGVALYFGLPIEPLSWAGGAATAGGLGLAVGLRRRPVLALAATLAAAASLGFAAAQLRTALVEAPMLARELDPVELAGRVIEVEALPDGLRVLLDRLAIERLAPEATPARVRISIRSGGEGLRPGDRVRLLAGLAPPSPPLAPGAFDFQRHAFFDRIGGYGFSYGAPRGIEPAADLDPVLETRLWFADLRQRVTGRVLAVLPGGSGAVAAALMTGSQAAIPEEVIVAMRDSGLAHILSISGLHMAIMAGTVFWLVRCLLSCPALRSVTPSRNGPPLRRLPPHPSILRCRALPCPRCARGS